MESFIVFIFLVIIIRNVFAQSLITISTNNNINNKNNNYNNIRNNINNDKTRIIGGVEAQWGDFKGAISIQYSNGQHFCGGTLINDNYVLTAAHCIANSNDKGQDPTYFQVMADDLTVTKNASSQRQIRSISHIVVHPQYDSDTLINDIGIMRTTYPFNLTSTLQPIPIINVTPEISMDCSIAGWGIQSFNISKISDNLMKANIVIINSINCNISYDGFIRKGMICAGQPEGGKDSCQGDSGGGLICNDQLCGVVSFGLDCGLKDYPGVYTDVSMYNDWIIEEIKYIDENIDSDEQSTTTESMLPENATVPYYVGVSANASIDMLQIYLLIATQLFYYLINYS